MHDAVALGDAAAARPVHADRVNLVDIGHRAIPFGEIANFCQRGDIPVHRVKAFANDDGRPTRGIAQQFLKMCDVVVAKHLIFAAGLADAFDHRIMIERVRQDETVRNQFGDGRNACLVRHIARRENERGFLAVQVREFVLQLNQRMIGTCNVSGAAPAPVPTRVAVSTMAPTTLGCWPMPR